MSLWSPNSITRNLFLVIIQLHPCTRELFHQIVVTVPTFHLFPSKECSRYRLLRCLVSDHQFFCKCLRVCFGQDSATLRLMPLIRSLLASSQAFENNSLCLMCTPIAVQLRLPKTCFMGCLSFPLLPVLWLSTNYTLGEMWILGTCSVSSNVRFNNVFLRSWQIHLCALIGKDSDCSGSPNSLILWLHPKAFFSPLYEFFQVFSLPVTCLIVTHFIFTAGIFPWV